MEGGHFLIDMQKNGTQIGNMQQHFLFKVSGQKT